MRSRQNCARHFIPPWRNTIVGGQPEVSLDRRSVKISDICNRVMDYNDPMPPGLVFLLNKEIYIDPTD